MFIYLWLLAVVVSVDCQVTECGTLSDPTNGNVNTSSGTNEGDTATYSCDTGYNLSGSATRTCGGDGIWTLSEPTCDPVDCGSPPTITNGAPGSPTSTTFGGTVTYNCTSGYETPSGMSMTTVSCLDTGVWGTVNCTAVDCGNLSIPNGQVNTTSGTTFNNVATYSCDEGHNLNGLMTRTCGADGMWTPNEPTCDPVDCGSPPSIANGSPGTPDMTTFGGMVTYTCTSGYETPSGTSMTTVSCLASGVWDTTNCTAVDCGGLPDPTDGQVGIPSGTTFNNTASYSCDPGYNLVGSMTRTCGDDGIWTLNEPTCDPVDPQLVADCGPLPGPTYGAVSTSSGTNENDTAIYRCDTGYRLNGVMIRTCEDDGQWTPDEPTCDLNMLTPGSGSGDMILPSLEPTTSIPPSSTTMNTPNVDPTSTSLNPPEPSSTPEPTTSITPRPTTPSPLEPLTTVSPADPPAIVFTFIGLSLDEFNSTVMDLLLSVVENITDIEANITVMATMVPNENITTVTLFFEFTGEVDDITIAREVQTALEDTDNPAWITLQQQYAVMFELVVVTTPTALSPTSQTPPRTIPLTIWQWIIVTVAATSLLLASLLTIFCCCRCLVLRKRRKPAKGYKRHLLTERELPYHHSPKSAVEMNGVHVQPRKVARITFRPKGLLQQLSHPLSVEELEALVNNTAALYGEYSSIPSNMVTIAEVPPGAEDKNRYRDVLPNPYTRVSLFLKFGVANSDYINANYVRGYKDSSKSYIATQGPLQWTVGDFWRMVWEQRSSTIIMVTGLEERGSTKCSRYWPDVAINHSTSYEDLEVRLKRRLSASNNEFVTTTFHLAHKQKMVSREVTHYWFTGWPDHGVPSTAKPIIEFLLQARGSIRDMPGPTVVHCSAGIGRTGVFIGADIGMQQLEDEGQVDILKTVATLRQDRGGMVQTKDQYVFLHKVLLEYAHYLAQVRNTYRSGYKGQGSYLHPTIEEDPTDRSVLLT